MYDSGLAAYKFLSWSEIKIKTLRLSLLPTLASLDSISAIFSSAESWFFVIIPRFLIPVLMSSIFSALTTCMLNTKNK